MSRISPVVIAATAVTAAMLGGCGGRDRDRARDPRPAPRLTTLEVARASGPAAKASAEATIANPIGLGIRASATPAQRVTVEWSASCVDTAKRSHGASRRGSYTAASTEVRRVRPPTTTDSTDVCTLRAWATPARGGRVRLTLLGAGPEG